MNLSMKDINKRLRRLDESSYKILDVEKYITECNKAIANRSPERLIFCIENAAKSKYLVQLDAVMNCFDCLCETGSIGQINKTAHYISEEVISKVRNAKESQTNLRRKLGRIKTRISTKINNNIADLMATGGDIVKAGKTNFKNNTSHINSKTPPKPDPKKDEAIEEACNVIQNKIDIYAECDRILENYNNLSKRFNLERLFEENTRINGVEDTIYELCRLVDTYSSSDDTKLHTVIESSYYSMKTRGISFTENEILVPAVNYFCNKRGGYNTCKKVLEQNVFYNLDPDNMDQGILRILMEDDPENEYQFAHSLTAIEEQIIGIYVKDTTPNLFDRALHEETDFNKLFADFKEKDDEHKENKLKSLINRLYTKNVDNIVDGTPKLLNWIRQVFVLSTMAINPILGAIITLADQFVRLHKSRKETEKMLKCFDKEIATVDKKIESSENDATIDNLEAYKDKLVEAREKINDYYESMLTSNELDARYDDNDDNDSTVSKDSFATIINDDEDTKKKKKKSNDDEDYDWMDDDWDDDFDDDDIELDEAVKVIPKIARLSTALNEAMNNTYINNPNSEEFTNLFYGTDLDSIAKFAAMNPDLMEPENLGRSISYFKEQCKYQTGYQKYEHMLMCESALNNLKTPPNIPFDIFQTKLVLENQVYGVTAINSMIDTHKQMQNNMVLEASFTNSLKLASEKLKKGLKGLSDKEKSASKTVDSSVNSMQRAIERSFTTDNREAVIKGSVLPSASKTIKLALTTGALFLVQPALAVIGVLGWIATSSKYKHKERQLVLDEIETELKICNKYIEVAESKNDMKALKQLFKIQRQLEHQQQRIKYNMKTKFSQQTYDIKGVDD